jgi:hypothetical protein
MRGESFVASVKPAPRLARRGVSFYTVRQQVDIYGEQEHAD